jgi:hypothetical protein
MKLRMPDGVIVDTDRAAACYEEARDWDGRNHVSRATGSHWGAEGSYASADEQRHDAGAGRVSRAASLNQSR